MIGFTVAFFLVTSPVNPEEPTFKSAENTNKRGKFICGILMLRLVTCNRLMNLGISKQKHLYLRTKNLI